MEDMVEYKAYPEVSYLFEMDGSILIYNLLKPILKDNNLEYHVEFKHGLPVRFSVAKDPIHFLDKVVKEINYDMLTHQYFEECGYINGSDTVTLFRLTSAKSNLTLQTLLLAHNSDTPIAYIRTGETIYRKNSTDLILFIKIILNDKCSALVVTSTNSLLPSLYRKIITNPKSKQKDDYIEKCFELVRNSSKSLEPAYLFDRIKHYSSRSSHQEWRQINFTLANCSEVLVDLI